MRNLTSALRGYRATPEGPRNTAVGPSPKQALAILGLVGVLLLPFGEAIAQSRDVRVHDPVMALQDGTYYLFHTGRGISVMASTDMDAWEPLPPVFQESSRSPWTS